MKPLHQTILGAVLAALMVVALPPARALDVFNYSSATNERFSSGFPGSPTANSSFFLSAYNLSGIGWSAGNFGITMISPRHFLTAAHVAPGAGTSVSFLNTDGVVKTYTVDSNYTVLHAAGVDTDLVVGRLSMAISTADHVSYYPTLLLSAGSDYLGLTVAGFGNGQRAGTNTIDAVGPTDMLPFGAPNGTSDNYVFVTDYDPVTGQTQGQGGDSGSPSFVGIGGNLVLIGTHSAVDTTASPDLTIDVLVPNYYHQIDARLALDGYSFGAFVAVPEPQTWASICGVLVFGWAVRVRKARERKCLRATGDTTRSA